MRRRWPRRAPSIVQVMLLCVAWLTTPGVAAAPPEDGVAGTPLGTAALAGPGPYPVVTREVVVTRRADGGDAFEARLYIPLQPEASDRSGPRAPIVAFGHGYLTAVEHYETVLRHLASWGITTIAPRSGGELLPDHAELAADLVAAIDWVVREASQDDLWPGLAIDGSARGVSGHSMGGGAAVLAAAMDPRIGSVATLAAAETRPSAIEAAAEVEAPVLFMAGSEDRLTPIGSHQRPMWAAKTTGPAQLRIVEGGSHCGFLDAAILFRLVCDEPSIDVATQRSISRAVLAAWFRATLLGDVRSAGLAWPIEPTDGTTVVTSGRNRAP